MDLEGQTWWTTGPMIDGLTDIVILVRGLRFRKGILAVRNYGRALAVDFMIDGIGKLLPDEEAALKEIETRHGQGEIRHDVEAQTVHLHAESPRRPDDNARELIDLMVVRIQDIFAETIVRALIKRSRWGIGL